MSRADRQTSTTADRAAIDFGACLAEVAGFIRRTWPSNIRLEVQVASTLPTAKCDQLDLQTAIMNLAFNARDAMPDGDVISIVVGGLSRSHVAAQVEVRVSDNSLAMTRETLARAFDPFFTAKTEGVCGLGLPMVECFAPEPGGSGEIESEPGAGTTVTGSQTFGS
jgi:signal transduction histidine kinase